MRLPPFRLFVASKPLIRVYTTGGFVWLTVGGVANVSGASMQSERKKVGPFDKFLLGTVERHLRTMYIAVELKRRCAECEMRYRKG